MLTLTILGIMITVLSTAAGIASTLYCHEQAGKNDRRRAMIRYEDMIADARIDLRTRQAVQQMRDIVREDLRASRQRNVVQAEVIE